MHTSLRGHTVDDVERVVVVQRTDTTDAHRSSTRGVTIGLNVHARHATLQGLHWIVLVLLRHLIDAPRRDGARQVGLALGGIASDHHFVQQLGILFHLDFHAGGGSHLHRVVADVCHHKDSPRLNLNLKISVEIGRSAVRRVFLLHSGSDDTFASLIDDRSRDFTLRVHYGTRKNE